MDFISHTHLSAEDRPLAEEATYELGNSILKLAPGLSFTLRKSGQSDWYQVRHEATGAFFRLGLPQYMILSMCDGKRTVNQISLAAATVLEQDAPTEKEIISFCQWALESGIVSTRNSSSSERLSEAQDGFVRQQVMEWLNPISIRIPIFRPDRFLAALNPLTRHLFSPVGLILWMGTIVVALLHLIVNWADFDVFAFGSFSGLDYVWFGLTWLALKFLHEAAHGLACKRFGGNVRSCGTMFLLFVPLPYIDVTSAWAFPQKHQRIFVSAAGMMAELFVAAIAVFVWFETAPGPVKYHAGNIIVAASLTTLLFNLNPLMKFDGYFILTDALEIPNLQNRARSYVRNLLRHGFLGIQSSTKLESHASWFVKTYGILALLWTTFVIVSLSIAAINLLDGIGLLIAMTGLFAWLGRPVYQFTRYLIFGNDTEQPNRTRFLLATGMAFGGLFILAQWLPGPTAIRAPCVIEYDPLTVIHSESAGVIREVLVDDCDTVKKGQLILTMENPELQSEFTEVNVRLKQAKLRSKVYRKEENIGLFQAQQKRVEALEQRLAKLHRMVDSLQVCAPAAGQVITADLKNKKGTFIHAGDRLFSVAQPDCKKVIALVSQYDAKWLSTHQGDAGKFIVWGNDEIEKSRAYHILPTASTTIPHLALAATNGGPMTVVTNTDPTNGTQASPKSNGSNKSQLRLSSPHVTVEFQLSKQQAKQYHAGQTGEFMVSSRNESIGSYLKKTVTRWFTGNIHRTHGL